MRTSVARTIMTTPIITIINIGQERIKNRFITHNYTPRTVKLKLMFKIILIYLQLSCSILSIQEVAIMLNGLINEIIFLGQVPGTNFQITFIELLMMSDTVLVLYLLRRRNVVRELRYYWQELKFYRLYWQVYLSTKKDWHFRLPV